MFQSGSELRGRLQGVLLVLLLLAGAPVCAQEAGNRDRVQAAYDNAMQSLRQQVDDYQIRPDLTVADVIEKIGGDEQLTSALAKAQRIGGPRWLNDQTCQVRLDISGATVADTLKDLVESNAKTSPVSSDALAPRLKALKQKTFCAVGNSTGANAIAGARPIREADGWAAVDDNARRDAVATAKRDAVSRVIEALRTVPIANDKTVGDAMNVKSVRDAVDQWLQSRPITRLEFQPDFQVKLTLAAGAGDLYNTFQTALKAQSQVPAPKDEKGWDEFRERFMAKIHRVTGRASATAPSKVVNAVQLPDTPPDWVQQQIDAEGFSKPKNEKLKAARAAEADALVRLRSQIEALPLTNGLTVGEAQKRDKRLAEAVGRAIKEAHPYKVDYESDGSAKVKVNLDLREVWEEIRSQP
jgi:hypothetical protein